jgi:hypothetical protein
MGLFRYIVQGFGWHVGGHVAREGIAALEDHLDAEQKRQPTKRQLAKLERAKRKAAKREAKRRRADQARSAAAIELQLRDLKKRAERR